MKKLPNIHPGEVLKEEFLIPMGISAYRLALQTQLPQTRISLILQGKRRITADTALRFARFFGNSPRFWLGLQDDYDLEEESRLNPDIHLIQPYRSEGLLIAEPDVAYTKKNPAKKHKKKDK